MKLLDIGLPDDISEVQIEKISNSAENKARLFILSKVPQKIIDTLSIIVEAEGSKPINFNVEIGLNVFSKQNNIDPQKLVDEAIEIAFKEIETCLRQLK